MKHLLLSWCSVKDDKLQNIGQVRRQESVALVADLHRKYERPAHYKHRVAKWNKSMNIKQKENHEIHFNQFYSFD